MSKHAIIALIVCAGVGVALLSIKSPAHTPAFAAAEAGMPSLLELQAKARNLPALIVKDLF